MLDTLLHMTLVAPFGHGSEGSFGRTRADGSMVMTLALSQEHFPGRRIISADVDESGHFLTIEFSARTPEDGSAS